MTYIDTVDNPESKKFAAEYQAKYKAAPDLFSDYGYVAAKALDEALKMIDGDTSNKDKLAEAMTKVQFNAPRGPFRMDPVTHNPIQDIYIARSSSATTRSPPRSSPLSRTSRIRARKSTDQSGLPQASDRTRRMLRIAWSCWSPSF